MGLASDSAKKGGWEDLESEPETVVTVEVTVSEVENTENTEEVPV